MLDQSATLVDVAFAVCSALESIDERALLVGGSAATYYAPHAYQSSDCDFILAFGFDAANVVSALAALGFARTATGLFHHPKIVVTVEFPAGPAAIGIDRIERYATIHRGNEILHVYSPTDVVRDRLIHFWAWGDYSALRVAIDVTRAQRAGIDYDAIVDWTNRELAEAPGGYDKVRRDLFLSDIRSALGIND